MLHVKRSQSYFKNAIQYFKENNSIHPEKSLQISKICKHSLDDALLAEYLSILTEAYKIQETDTSSEKLKKILKFYQKNEKEFKKGIDMQLKKVADKLATKVTQGRITMKSAHDEFDKALEYLMNQFSKEIERSIQCKKVGELASREYFLVQTIANGQKPSDPQKLKNAMRKDFEEIAKKNISLNFFKSQLLTHDEITSIIEQERLRSKQDPAWQSALASDLVRSASVSSMRNAPILGAYKLQQNENAEISDSQVSLSDTTWVEESLSESEQTESYSSTFELSDQRP